MKRIVLFAVGFGCGVVLGKALYLHKTGGISMWAALSPEWMSRWGRETDSAANEERARRTLEMDAEV